MACFGAQGSSSSHDMPRSSSLIYSSGCLTISMRMQGTSSSHDMPRTLSSSSSGDASMLVDNYNSNLCGGSVKFGSDSFNNALT